MEESESELEGMLFYEQVSEKKTTEENKSKK